MQKSELLRTLQQEIRRHAFNYFIDEPPSIAQGGKRVAVPGAGAESFEATGDCLGGAWGLN